jgi:hypothetical protein
MWRAMLITMIKTFVKQFLDDYYGGKRFMIKNDFNHYVLPMLDNFQFFCQSSREGDYASQLQGELYLRGDLKFYKGKSIFFVYM